MTVQALYTAATGMQAMETKLDVVANNLANINTTAFKKGGRTLRTCSTATIRCLRGGPAVTSRHRTSVGWELACRHPD